MSDDDSKYELVDAVDGLNCCNDCALCGDDDCEAPGELDAICNQPSSEGKNWQRKVQHIDELLIKWQEELDVLKCNLIELGGRPDSFEYNIIATQALMLSQCIIDLQQSNNSKGKQ